MKARSFFFSVLGVALWLGLLIILRHPQGLVTLENAPTLLVLVSSLYSLLLPLRWSLCLSAIAVLIFNYEMVPPIHTFHVDLSAHGFLLITVTGVSWIITWLLRRQKQIAAQESRQAMRIRELMQWSERLREVDEPQELLAELQTIVTSRSIESEAVVLGLHAPLWPPGIALNVNQLEGFNACLKENKALGHNTGRYENLDDLYLPLRGKSRAYGVCLLIGLQTRSDEDESEIQDVQAMLDQMGLALERKESHTRMQNARELAQIQATRSLFLTSIAHDQRTPLASIMASASAILEQGDNVSADEVRYYSTLIYSESQQIARLTDNTLALARLSGEQVQVPMGVESVEDMLGAVLQRLRKRGSEHMPQVHVEPGLPLLTCNMVLVEQVLDNLIDNAVKHSGAPGSVVVHVSQNDNHVLFQVRDSGRGLSEIEMKQGDKSRGLGIGLQLCQAVAQVHQGSLDFTKQTGTGFVATFSLPVALVQK